MLFLSILLGVALGIDHFPSKWGFGDEIAPYELEDLTALEEYVRRPDPHFRYELWEECSEREATYNIYCFKMWSQQWLNESVWYSPHHENAVWWHWMVVIVPRKFDEDMKNHVYMQIEAGSNGNNNYPNIHDNEDIDAAKLLAVGGGIVTSIIFQVPNQRIKFYDDWWYENGEPHGRKEDEFCGYTWRLFMNDLTGEPMPEMAKGWGEEIIAYFPMTKAATKGLDLLEEFLKEEKNIDVEGFLVAGGSKRGWTTWFTGIVEPVRVKAIAPVVLDVLNMHTSLKHSFMMLGNWSFAYEDFYRENITQNIDTEEFFELIQHIDVYTYRKKLANMPIVAVTCSGDPFFMIDDSSFYLEQMKELGEIHRYLMGNCEHSTLGHSLTNGNMFRNIFAWFKNLITGNKSPEISWEHGFNGDILWATLTIEGDLLPDEVNIKYSETVEEERTTLWRKDWRWTIPENEWDLPGYHESDKYPASKDGERGSQPVLIRPVKVFPRKAIGVDEKTYYFEMNIPSNGWLAFWFDATFTLPSGDEFTTSSDTFIGPDTYLTSEPVCFGEGECRGGLV